MKTMEELRRRIANVGEVQSIVSTMKTMAAVQIRQYEEAANAMTEYLNTIQLGFHVLFHDRPIPAIDETMRTTTGVIIFGSDQGLCGRFNEDIARYVFSGTAADAEPDKRLIVVGHRVSQFVPSSYHVERLLRVPASIADITTLCQELMPSIERWRNDGVGRIRVYYNSRAPAGTYASAQYQLYPLSIAFLEECKSQAWKSRGLPSYTMSWNKLFASVVRQYFFVGLYRACAESRASENASRIASMQSAGKNVDRRLHELRTEFNETRQAAITEEILDIVAGVEALSR